MKYATNFYKYQTPDSSLVQYAGGVGKAFASIGKSMDDIDESKKLDKARKENIDFQKAKFDLDKENANRNFEFDKEIANRNYELNKAKFELEKAEASKGKGLGIVYSGGYAYLPYKTKDGTIDLKPLIPNIPSKDAIYGYNTDGTIKTAYQWGEEQAKNRKNKTFGHLADLEID